MALSVLYVAFHRVLQLFLLLFRSTQLKELEIVGLRHELAVLRKRLQQPCQVLDRFIRAVEARGELAEQSAKLARVGERLDTALEDGEVRGLHLPLVGEVLKELEAELEICWRPLHP